ncbi:enoyl-CoA hydratase [Paraglaciecola sp. 20A4]|uniref:enoyl-CoA hydratase n=1 Tax=Paraglaciecola sp. 20A4 TaxID=2687288 RepID=UPI00140A8A15|nr:enoyl-CoA hydratase [Paraglaciecola sp. 20A4]
MGTIEAKNQTTSPVLTETIGKVALITLNRPDRLNAISEGLSTALIKAIKSADAAKDVNVIVLTGAGRAFCAGVDLKDVAGNDSNIIESRDMTDTFAQCTKPIIGAINGAAITGGLELALCCDFLYAADSAIFGDTHAKVGLMPTWGMSQKLPRIIGISRAREMSLSGDIIDASTAMQWGLVNKLCSKETLLEETLTKAQSIAEHIQGNTQKMKKLINEGWQSTLEQGLLLEEKYSFPHNRTVDLAEMMKVLEQVKKKNK